MRKLLLLLLSIETGLEAYLVDFMLALLRWAHTVLGGYRGHDLGDLLIQWLLLITDFVLVGQLYVFD